MGGDGKLAGGVVLERSPADVACRCALASVTPVPDRREETSRVAHHVGGSRSAKGAVSVRPAGKRTRRTCDELSDGWQIPRISAQTSPQSSTIPERAPSGTHGRVALKATRVTCHPLGGHLEKCRPLSERERGVLDGIASGWVYQTRNEMSGNQRGLN